MKISVAMAIYNGRKYINEQLNSIVNQNYPPDEIVLIDDCSDNCCDEIINKYEIDNPNIKFIYKKHSKNEGYSKTFFEAIECSTGDYVFLSDQDDIWAPDKVKSMIKQFSNNKVLCLSCKNIIVDGDGQEVKKEKARKVLLEKVSPYKIINQKGLRPGMSLVISRELILMLQDYDTAKYEMHDRFIELIASCNSGLYVYNVYLNKYRIHNTNTSGLNLTRKPRSSIDDRIKQAVKESNYLNDIINEVKMEDNLKNYCYQYYRYFKKRELVLSKKRLVAYCVKVLPLLRYFSNYKMLLGDIYCLIKRN